MYDSDMTNIIARSIILNCLECNKYKKEGFQSSYFENGIIYVSNTRARKDIIEKMIVKIKELRNIFSVDDLKIEMKTNNKETSIFIRMEIQDSMNKEAMIGLLRVYGKLDTTITTSFKD